MLRQYWTGIVLTVCINWSCNDHLCVCMVYEIIHVFELGAYSDFYYNKCMYQQLMSSI